MAIDVRTCDHGLVFDEELCKRESPGAHHVRKQFPRLDGVCPKGCGFHGIAYASFAHFLWGDW